MEAVMKINDSRCGQKSSRRKRIIGELLGYWGEVRGVSIWNTMRNEEKDELKRKKRREIEVTTDQEIQSD